MSNTVNLEVKSRSYPIGTMSSPARDPPGVLENNAWDDLVVDGIYRTHISIGGSCLP